MITGTVSSNEARFSLLVSGAGGEEREVEAVIDTGFNGFLTLPPEQVAALALPRLGSGRAILANGSEAVFDIHEVTVRWDGQLITVEADACGACPLVGMALLEGYKLRIEVVDGGRVTILVL